jgi:hypothetical protein
MLLSYPNFWSPIVRSPWSSIERGPAPGLPSGPVHNRGPLLLDLRDWLFPFSNTLSCFANGNSRRLVVFSSLEIGSRNRKPVFCERIREL